MQMCINTWTQVGLYVVKIVWFNFLWTSKDCWMSPDWSSQRCSATLKALFSWPAHVWRIVRSKCAHRWNFLAFVIFKDVHSWKWRFAPLLARSVQQIVAPKDISKKKYLYICKELQADFRGRMILNWRSQTTEKWAHLPTFVLVHLF